MNFDEYHNNSVTYTHPRTHPIYYNKYKKKTYTIFFESDYSYKSNPNWTSSQTYILRMVCSVKGNILRRNTSFYSKEGVRGWIHRRHILPCISRSKLNFTIPAHRRQSPKKKKRSHSSKALFPRHKYEKSYRVFCQKIRPPFLLHPSTGNTAEK